MSTYYSSGWSLLGFFKYLSTNSNKIYNVNDIVDTFKYYLTITSNNLNVFKVTRVAAQKISQNLNAKDPIIIQFLNDYHANEPVNEPSNEPANEPFNVPINEPANEFVNKLANELVAEPGPVSQETNKRSSPIQHNFSHDFSHFLDQNHLCDVTIELANRQEVKAHALILCARSFFRQILSIDNTEHYKITIFDVNPMVFNALLRYMYSGTLIFDNRLKMFDLYIAAVKFDLQEVVRTKKKDIKITFLTLKDTTAIFLNTDMLPFQKSLVQYVSPDRLHNGKKWQSLGREKCYQLKYDILQTQDELVEQDNQIVQYEQDPVSIKYPISASASTGCAVSSSTEYSISSSKCSVSSERSISSSECAVPTKCSLSTKCAISTKRIAILYVNLIQPTHQRHTRYNSKDVYLESNPK
ncbi:7927_t:CDS:2 [Cetraspora pellucida]|uniref:7927_t:CDS:1 n=1 Tax=Cetraspora pellucida TaxID=1433469 RepID=A0A9N9CLI0_9GLOM|nr:7927_t:CDS:2 [Cetraspora pellucida]